MSELTYTERAKAWIDESEPTAIELLDAYQRMKKKLEREPGINGDDAEACLELLSERFVEAGGDPATLIALEPETNAGGDLDKEYRFDATPLYEVSDSPAVELAPGEKLAAFLKLKNLYGGAAAF